MVTYVQIGVVLWVMVITGPVAVWSQNSESIQDFLNRFCRQHPNNKGCHDLPPPASKPGRGGCPVGSRPCTENGGHCLPIDIDCNYIGSPETCTLPPDSRIIIQTLVCGSGSTGQRCDRQFQVPLLTEIVVQCKGEQGHGSDIDLLSLFKADSGGVGGVGVYRCLKSNQWGPTYQGSPLLSHLIKSCYFASCGRLPSPPGNAGSHQLWPWVRHVKDNLLTVLCTGTLVDNNVLLTAAHCVTRSQNSRIPVSTLERLITLQNHDTVQHVQAERIYIHPGYTGDDLRENDLAIIKFKLQPGDPPSFPHACLPLDTLPNSKPDGVVFRLEEQFLGLRWRSAAATYSPSCSSLQAPSCSTRPQRGQFCAHHSSFPLEEGSSGGPYLVNVSPTLDYTWVVLGVYSRAHWALDECNPNYVFNSVHTNKRWIEDCVLYDNCRT